MITKCICAILVLASSCLSASAQFVPPPAELASTTQAPNLWSASGPSHYSLAAIELAPTSANPAPFIVPPATPDAADGGGVQTKRIAGVVPNFQAVSADTVLPPLTFRQKFALANQGNFDYSSFVFVGLQASIEQATNTYPEFGHGSKAFTDYYWHTFVDQAGGNYISGALLPGLTHEDPRYYTRYHGGFLSRAKYAFSRLLITRNDAGRETFNISEVVGVGITTELSGLYYPEQERFSLSDNCVRWASQLLNDGASNLFEEFWPDINRKFFHEH